MKSIPIPQSLMEILSLFRSCFSKRAFRLFCIIVVGWILCLGRHCLSRIFQASGAIENGQHHATLYRFFSLANWSMDALGKVLLVALLCYLPDEIEAPIDDTLNHSSGPHLFGAAMHFDAKKSTYGKGASGKRHTAFRYGHNWVILSVYLPLPWNPTGGVAIPVLFRLYRSPKRCPESEYRKRTEQALDLMKLFCSWLPEGRRALFLTDSEYACETILPYLPQNAHFVGPMVMEAALYEQKPERTGQRGRPASKGKRLPSPKKLAASDAHPWTERTLTVYGKEVPFRFKSQTCLWYSVAGGKLLRMAVTHDPSGRIEDRAYFCTDPCRSPEQFLVSFSHRWPLECTFRDGKQLLHIQDPQNGWWKRRNDEPVPPRKPGPNPHATKGRTAVEHTFPLGCLCYGIVILWYLRHGNPQHDVELARRAAPWYRHKTQPSFADMLSALRREIWMLRISQHPILRRVRRQIVEFMPAWLWAA